MKVYLYTLLMGLVLGCGQAGMSPEEKLALLVPDAQTTVPVTGNVLVDGYPAKDVWVYLIPKVTQRAKDTPAESRGRTDENGEFEITTYMEGDGAPAGEYVICFEWLRFRQTGGQWIGPDKLGKKYSDPSKSEFEVTIGQEAVELPPFELNTQGSGKGRS